MELAVVAPSLEEAKKHLPVTFGTRNDGRPPYGPATSYFEALSRDGRLINDWSRSGDAIRPPQSIPSHMLWEQMAEVLDKLSDISDVVEDNNTRLCALEDLVQGIADRLGMD